MTKNPALNNAINTNLRLIGTLTFKSNYTSPRTQVSVKIHYCSGKKQQASKLTGMGMAMIKISVETFSARLMT